MSDTEEFLQEIFGEKEGLVYAPTKNTATGAWNEYFFSWPDQSKDLHRHLVTQSRQLDVYLSPSFFNKHSSKKTAWKGSHYVWIEFDGNAPVALNDGIPEPTIRIQSSERGHEHWYWRLKNFETDYHVLETLSKQLSYTLEADLSGWDAGQVLRPPGTRHHESGRRVRVTKRNPGEVDYENFHGLKEVPQDLEIDITKKLPAVNEVISKYRIPGEVYELFTRESQPKGSRSSAMTRLAHHCIELKMTNEETFSLLLDADERWGKFKTRPPEQRRARIIGIIQHVRSKQALDSELLLSNKIIVYTVGDLLSTEFKLNWVYENLLHEQGLGIIAANPGVGKSTVSFQLGLKAALGKDFLKWVCAKKMKTFIISAEMQQMECSQFLQTMLPGYTPEEQDFIRQNVTIITPGKFALDRKDNQQQLLDVIDAHEPNLIIGDSLNALVSKKKEEEIDGLFEFINTSLRMDRKATVWLIHHLRKPSNEGARKPQDISDLYGDQYIGAHATTVLALWKRGQQQLEVLNFKTRMAPETADFWINRTEHLDFYETDIPENPSTEVVPTFNRKSNGGSAESSHSIGF